MSQRLIYVSDEREKSHLNQNMIIFASMCPHKQTASCNIYPLTLTLTGVKV